MIDVMIEIGRGQRVKRCMDAAGRVTGERTAPSPYPYSYGYVVGTVDGEGDGVDCWVVSPDSCEPCASIKCEPFGLLEFFEDGEIDHKVLAVPRGQALAVDAAALRDELESYARLLFSAYPDVTVRTGEILPASDAIALIEAYRRPFSAGASARPSLAEHHGPLDHAQ